MNESIIIINQQRPTRGNKSLLHTIYSHSNLCRAMRRFSSLRSILLFTLQTIITNIFLLLKSARAFTAVARSTKRYSCPKRLYLTQTMPPSERIQWKVRPATLADKNAVNELLMNSYENLLAADYDQEFLETALPLISKGREELLTCGTWYVVEDPRDGTLTGCGGWTFRNPAQERAADGRKVPHLRHFATRADMTRKGIESTYHVSERERERETDRKREREVESE